MEEHGNFYHNYYYVNGDQEFHSNGNVNHVGLFVHVKVCPNATS